MVARLALLALPLAACTRTPSNADAADFALAPTTIPCTSEMQCPKELPMCHPDSKICVGCLSNFQTCGPMMTCDDATHRCVPADPNAPCKRTADCPRPGFDNPKYVACEVDAGRCVECSSTADCSKPGDVCLSGLHRCGDPCSVCTPDEDCLNRVCVRVRDAGVPDGG